MMFAPPKLTLEGTFKKLREIANFTGNAVSFLLPFYCSFLVMVTADEVVNRINYLLVVPE